MRGARESLLRTPYTHTRDDLFENEKKMKTRTATIYLENENNHKKNNSSLSPLIFVLF